MTEIPEHLLERSRARRAALGLGGDAGAAPAPSAAEGAAAPAATASSAAPARAAAAAAPVPAKAPEIVLSPYAQAAVARKKIPFWAVPVLIFLPLWGFLYWGTLDPHTAKAAGPLAAGATVYNHCAACHGASGGGGAGPAFDTVKATFPDFEQHVWWVISGSNNVTKGAPYGAADRPGGQRVSIGNMPAWGSQITAKELLEAVYYERVQFGGVAPADLTQLAALIASPNLPTNFPEGKSLDEIKTLLDGIVPPTAAK